MSLTIGYKKEINLFLAVVLLGQILFAISANNFTIPRYEGRIYATTGVKHKQEDLHKLNEAAHYFGQTMIGWLKFPNFFSNLQNAIKLPDASGISAHIQERQNIIFTIESSTPIELESLKSVKDYLQGRINEYNSITQTEFVLSNLDYELIEIQKSYRFGALITFIASAVIALALIFIRKELF